MISRVLRYEVPVDDQWHEMPIRGEVMHVGSRSPFVVEFWALRGERSEPVSRTFRVFGTGHEIKAAADVKPVGSVIVGTGALVWHLVELAS